jgi:predicted O-methyltransferase YrrM
VLKKWIDIIEPRRILEWGPGISTQIMERHTSDTTEIITIEHQRKWFEYWKERLPARVSMILLEEDEAGDMPFYTNPPVSGKFYIIFIDGRHRVQCMKTALALLPNGGVVILHDSERPEYQEGIALYNKIYDEDGTAVLERRRYAEKGS